MDTTQSFSQNSDIQKPITDLSPHVVQLARQIDRLPPGNYTVNLVKSEFKQQDWEFSINREEKIASGSLSSRKYLSE